LSRLNSARNGARRAEAFNRAESVPSPPAAADQHARINRSRTRVNGAAQQGVRLLPDRRISAAVL